MERAGVFETEFDWDFGWDSDWSSNWWDSYSRQRSSYLRGASKIWSWKLAPEEEFPTLKGIKKFAKLLQGPGKDIVVRFKDDSSAPAYYNPTHRVVVVSYGEKWREALKHEWWPEAMAAHEIGHVRFTPEFDNFPVWNLIEDRRIEESMIRLFPKLREKFERVFEFVLSSFCKDELKEPEELLYPAALSFHYRGAEPTVESVEKATGKRIAVSEVNGYPLEEFLKDLYSLTQEALSLAGESNWERVRPLYRKSWDFYEKYFPDTFDWSLLPVQDYEIADEEANEIRKNEETIEEFARSDRFNGKDSIEHAFYGGILVDEEKIPKIKRGVLKRFLSFFPPALSGRQFAEEGARIDVRRYVRGQEDFFISPKKTPAPYCIDVVIDGSGSMGYIENIYEENQEEFSYVRKVLRLLQEAERVSRLRFRVMITSTYLLKPLILKGDYDGEWLPYTFRFHPDGGEGFARVVSLIKARTVLVITDGRWSPVSLDAVKDLSRKKAVLGVYIQGENGFPWEDVKENVENFHRFLYLKNEDDLWKIGKELARLV